MGQCFFCIACKEVHDESKANDMVFKTGFQQLADGRDLPLGVCSEKRVESASA